MTEISLNFFDSLKERICYNMLSHFLVISCRKPIVHLAEITMAISSHKKFTGI